MPANVYKRWAALKEKVAGKTPMEQARAVNLFFNQWPYRTDMELWSVNEYWETPEEFIKKSGDCEDYAISKYYALRALGVPAERLRIVAVKDTIRGIGHAVLAFYEGDTAYILDNLSTMLIEHKRLTHYLPQFSVNEQFRWRHARIIKPPRKK